MHTFSAFFSWPNGACWGNIIAVPPCAVLAAILAFIFRDRIGKSVKGWWKRHFGHGDELDEIQGRLDAHADALDLTTPGGLTAVLAEVKAARQSSEAALAAVQGLTKLVAPTPMRKTAAKPAAKTPRAKP